MYLALRTYNSRVRGWSRLRCPIRQGNLCDRSERTSYLHSFCGTASTKQCARQLAKQTVSPAKALSIAAKCCVMLSVHGAPTATTVSQLAYRVPLALVYANVFELVLDYFFFAGRPP